MSRTLISRLHPRLPPSGDTIWKVLTDLLAGKEPHLPHELLHYD